MCSDHPWIWPVSVAAHLTIAVGYLAVPSLVLRYLSLTRSVNAAGIAFLLLGASTHVAAVVVGDDSACSPWWAALRLGYATMLIVFLVGFHRLLRAADRHRARRGASQRSTP